MNPEDVEKFQADMRKKMDRDDRFLEKSSRISIIVYAIVAGLNVFSFVYFLNKGRIDANILCIILLLGVLIMNQKSVDQWRRTAKLWRETAFGWQETSSIWRELADRMRHER